MSEHRIKFADGEEWTYRGERKVVKRGKKEQKVATKTAKKKDRKKAAKSAWEVRRKKYGKNGISKEVLDKRAKSAKKKVTKRKKRPAARKRRPTVKALKKQGKAAKAVKK